MCVALSLSLSLSHSLSRYYYHLRMRCTRAPRTKPIYPLIVARHTVSARDSGLSPLSSKNGYLVPVTQQSLSLSFSLDYQLRTAREAVLFSLTYLAQDLRSRRLIAVFLSFILFSFLSRRLSSPRVQPRYSPTNVFESHTVFTLYHSMRYTRARNLERQRYFFFSFRTTTNPSFSALKFNRIPLPLFFFSSTTPLKFRYRRNVCRCPRSIRKRRSFLLVYFPDKRSFFHLRCHLRSSPTPLLLHPPVLLLSHGSSQNVRPAVQRGRAIKSKWLKALKSASRQ